MEKVRRPSHGPGRQRGLTLVELMIALVVGLMLMAGILQLFVSQQQAFRTHQALARLQERGRIALELIGREVRRADYWGCLPGVEAVGSVLDDKSSEFDPLRHGVSAGLEASSEKLVLRSLEEVDGGLQVLNNPMSSEAANLQVAKGSSVKQFDILMVSDCDQGTLFEVTNARPGTSGTLVHNSGTVKEGPGNRDGQLGKRYGQQAGVFRLVTRGFQVDPDEPLGRRALENSGGQDLVLGVERMALRFGEDTDEDGSADRYLPVGAAGLDLGRVLSIRISLLLYSEDGVGSGSLPYRFDGVHYNGGSGSGEGPLPKDRRLRQEFAATFALRNRLE